MHQLHPGSGFFFELKDQLENPTEQLRTFHNNDLHSNHHSFHRLGGASAEKAQMG